eukprot:m.58203 g.58203  ORF g.58203 m.58203 type:complete len:157 (+) comp18977_c0_seq1:3-473(+)
MRLLLLRSYCFVPRFVRVGETFSLEKTFSSADVQTFARISGDDNPIHLDKDYAATTPFGRPIVHGVLMNGLISAILGTKYPGNGTIYLNGDFQFKAPLFVGEQVTAEVTVAHVEPKKPVATFHTICKNKEDKILLEGQAKVMFPRGMMERARHAKD